MLAQPEFNWKDEARQLLIIALPIIATQLLQVGMGFVDAIMAGKISALTLAAIALGSSIYVVSMLLGIGVMLALVPTISQHLGAERKDKVREELRQGIWLALLVGIVIMFLAYVLVNNLALFGVEASIIPVAQAYVYWIIPCLPFICLSLVPRSFNEAQGNTLPMLWIQLLLLPLNILGNYIFMFGKWGVEPLGAAGAALSTTLASILGCVLLFIYTLKAKRYEHFDLAKRMTLPNFAHIMSLLKLGAPISISLGMESGMFAFMALLMGSFGVINTAGHQIALNVASLAFMIPLGISMALTVRVGLAIGSKQAEHAHKRAQLGVLLCAGFMCFSGINMGLWRESIAAFYTDDAQVVAAASHFLIFAAIFQLFDGLQVGAAGALRGYKDTRIPMLMNTFCYWGIGISCGYWLSQHTFLSANGLWIGLLAGLSMAALLLNIRLYRLGKTFIIE